MLGAEEFLDNGECVEPFLENEPFIRGVLIIIAYAEICSRDVAAEDNDVCAFEPVPAFVGGAFLDEVGKVFRDGEVIYLVVQMLSSVELYHVGMSVKLVEYLGVIIPYVL